ncbi:MAG TPA: DUF11 domain-containing protein, partial [Thermoanaerobaculia bacterium]|nr:DUF11 domain-containing protein [Thermoanaerobaculia bacterium]
NDGTIMFGFSANSSISDPVGGNNSETESTAYVTPDADVYVLVADSPDPVTPDGNITYTVTVGNNGPDTAPNITLNSFGGNNLRFVSATIPAGWNCTLPPSGTQTTSLSCTLASMTSGDSDVLTFVMEADSDLNGFNDGTIMFGFSANSSISDPVGPNNSETESTAYSTPDANLSVTATDAPDPVAAGSNLTYTGTIANAGPDAGTNTTFTAALDPSLLFQSVVGPAGFTCTTPAVGATGNITCTMASMPSGASLPFSIVAQVNPGLNNGPDGVLQSTFLIGSGAADPVLANNEVDVATSYTTPDADLSTTNTDTPDPVVQGGTITYTQTMTNNGPNPAVNATLTETLPASVGFQSIAAPAGYTCSTPAAGASGLITCSIASLASGVTSTFTVVVEVLASSGTVGNTTTVDSDTYDPDPADNQATTSTTITPPASADLSISKSTPTTTVTPNGTYTYTIVITNNGPDTATNVVMTDVLPAQLQFQSITSQAGWTCTTPAVGANGTVTCTGGALGNTGTATFQLTVRVAPGTAPGTVISNTASVSSATADGDNSDNSSTSATVEVNATSADLSIDKTTTATSVGPGATYSYTIVVTNNGPNTASNVVMTDVLPAQLRFQSITTQAGWTCTTPAVGTNGTVNCTGGALGNGGTATFVLTVSVAPNATAGAIVNTASVSSATGDPNGANSSDTAPTVNVSVLTSDLSITKNTATTNAPAGSSFNYTIAITNSGPDAATNVVMTDTLPASLLFQSLTIPTGFTCTTPAAGTTGTITCNAATLANGATATFQLTVRVAGNATSGSVTNSASVSGANSDPDGGDTTDPAPPVGLGPGSADLSIVKMTTSTTAVTGSIVNYTIDVTNSGPSQATNVVVTDTLPAGLELVSVTPSQGTCSGTTTITCNLGTINNGGSATINLSTRVIATSGTISNTASVDGNETDPDGGDTSSGTPPIPVGEPGAFAAIPTMSEWALLALAAMLGMLAVMKMRE